ncbi:efflux RND transporter periplasmic adaptor subunit [Testudinibacter aquarius]|uniref:Efflux RND transporter periplasmic adaptor subunit n=1 Tax=Testudinibacter aquarius TaxID=1524974 RepID=A0A4R3YDR9_9PAST|nr:efflux RND transporter periplasmic adaptor subunit [Testudinibacter aquarius]KAE9528996.1 efflux transporter periplasmic adaptor subunit [Testudinibacter aquarius]TCV89278.1 membrane fusion protein (multidrug efflux system) [Testudinibacter aquarius]TNG93332.1 efflux RND transporter periplasmic adaptor subunit [Testudinibacter aquarius]
MSDIQTNKPKRSRSFVMKLVLLIVILAFAAVIGLQIIKSRGMAAYFANMPEAINPVTVTTVQTQQWTPAIEATGIIRPNQGAMLSSQMAGSVKSIFVQAGQHVKKGDLLIELDSDVEKANLAAYQAQLTSVQANYQRYQTLFRSKSVSKSELDNAESSYRALVANIEAAKATIARRQIYAPFDGVTGIIQVNVGQYVTIGQAMVRVEDISTTKIDFSLGQNSLENLFIGQKVTAVVDAFVGETFSAKISAIEPAVTSTSGLIDLQATVEDSRDKLLSGMFARVRVALTTEYDQIVLPQVAIAYNMYGESVYRLTALSEADKEKYADNQNLDKMYRANLVTVNTLERSGIYSHLKSGSLQFGDIIVTGGQQRLSNGSLVVVSDQAGVGTEQPAATPKL